MEKSSKNKMNWIELDDKVDLSNIAFIKCPHGIFALPKFVGIFQHEEIFYNLITATHYIPFPFGEN